MTTTTQFLQEKRFRTTLGTIHYWTNTPGTTSHTLVFLPGLTADHRLFFHQIEHFRNSCRLLVWDAPGHYRSRPFSLQFSLMETAAWLHEILSQEGIGRPILIGQSMGGYVAQCYMQQFPEEIAGFISIDSAPLQRRYTSWWEIALLRRCEWMYRLFPWQTLIKAGADGCAESETGRRLMREMMAGYDKREYCALAGHGYRMLADAMEADLPYVISCPALLLCGEKDRAASTRRYNKAWTQQSGLPLVWVPDAGHNANCDNPEFVNRQIEMFLHKL